MILAGRIKDSETYNRKKLHLQPWWAGLNFSRPCWLELAWGPVKVSPLKRSNWRQIEIPTSGRSNRNPAAKWKSNQPA